MSTHDEKSTHDGGAEQDRSGQELPPDIEAVEEGAGVAEGSSLEEKRETVQEETERDRSEQGN